MGTPGSTTQRRVKTATVLQMEAVESGAAALAMVLEYHRRFVSLEELRIACGVSRSGTEAKNLVKAAAHYGLEAELLSQDATDLCGNNADLPLPAIVSWRGGHFVVLEGFGRRRVYINDPAQGRRAVALGEFEQAFAGHVLTFRRGPPFQPGGQPRGLIRPLLRRLRGVTSGLVFVIVASLFLTLTGLLLPVFTGVFIDYILVGGRAGWVAPLLFGMVLTAALRVVLTWLQRDCLRHLENKLALTQSYHFFRHLLRLPVEFFTQRSAGEIGGRVQLNDQIARLLSGTLATNLLNVLTVALYLFLMFWLDALLTLVSVVIAVLNFAALVYVSRRRRAVNVHLLQERANLTATATAGLQAIESLKATGAESSYFSRWAGYLAREVAAVQQMDLYTLYLGSIPPLLASLNLVTILAVGGLRIIDGHLTLGMLVAFQSLMTSFLEPIDQFVGLGKALQQTEGEMQRLDDVLHSPTDPALLTQLEPTTVAHLPPKLTGRLELKDVIYGYSRLEPPLIVDLNLRVEPGMRVALVGPSGSGKSTLARLICGLYQPWQGEVRLDDLPRRQLPRTVVTNSLALVDQDFFLFEGTIRDVLTLWDVTVPEEDMVQAAKDACIHEAIAARPGAYGSKVEEGGANFSGGQRQRLEIARALVHNPSLLVLDEATSALDPITEKQVDDNLRRRGCTCVVVAHRLSTIRDCDRIFVLDNGKIVQQGLHDELMKSEDGLYRHLVQTMAPAP
jgi:NHLM bacteriocin system ABC transporter peptidase/ATP-binding protein